MSNKRTWSTLFLLVLTLALLSCSGASPNTANQTAVVNNQSNTTNQTTKISNQSTTVNQTVVAATPLPTPKKEGVVSLEAGLVFQSGDIKPVARTTFYLLDESAVKLMRQAGVKSSGGEKSDVSIAGAYGISSKYSNNPNASRANELIKKHSIQSVTTDFGGKAKFNPVPQGTYYLFGISSTPKGFAIWDMKVDLNSAENSVTLDQNNAVVAL